MVAIFILPSKTLYVHNVVHISYPKLVFMCWIEFLKSFCYGVANLFSILCHPKIVLTNLHITLGPKGREVVLEMKYGSTKIVSDEEFVAKEVELEDPVENISAKLVRQADAKYTSLVDEKPKDSPSSMSTKSVHERLAEEDETRSLGWLPASG